MSSQESLKVEDRGRIGEKGEDELQKNQKNAGWLALKVEKAGCKRCT